MNYNHLTIEERRCIRKYYNDGKSFREIGKLIGRSASTISREIMKNKTYMISSNTTEELSLRLLYNLKVIVLT
ncbi:MAG: helix-turn-helix domain-containing protein [Eubacteriales bacterium]|nr:helix-turn-helix domain-containing protein [Eubacteriales bacterium]